MKYRLQGFQLDEHPRTLVAVLLFLALLAYGFIDGFITPAEGYAGAPPYWLFAVAAMAVAVATLPWLRAGAVPRREAAGIALMLGAGVGFALFAGLLRIDAWLYGEATAAHPYTLGQGSVLTADDGRSPPLRAPIDAAYWAQQSPGEQWQIQLHRGLFGTWHYRRAPLQKDIDIFYTLSAAVEMQKQQTGRPWLH